ncbi:SciE type virulence protein [Vineibacter terrae]|uniref:SciE type virulence protein n=1 Tax=Vineibacter terrae TaxID=2586908 RepID=A0A5C8PPR0_9HYPH|nr:type VI secretion system accessory protein TagJ [Vineibacter terrae]TXL77155.1 SciE type virulence protein [Vineibacter terrae]
MTTDAKSLFRDGKLAEAIEAQTATVRDKPSDSDARAFLADLLMLVGAYEKADRQLDALSTQHTKLAVGVALSRQLVRAAMARQEVFEKGRAPEVATEPGPCVQAALQALLHLREGRTREAAALLSEADEKRTRTAGRLGEGGAAFEDFRDADDLCAGFVEVMTSTGKYFWIPIDRIDLMEFEKPSRPRDIIWRQCKMEVRGGPEGVVYVPATYPILPADGDIDLFRLGRTTEWVGGDGEPTRGLGLRMFLVGDDGLSIDELQTVQFGAG